MWSSPPAPRPPWCDRMRFLNGHTIRDTITGLSAAVEARKQTPTGNALNVQIGPGDPISNIPVVMDLEHHQVHEGETYRAQDVQASLGVTTVKYSLTVPAASPDISPPHMVVSADIYNGAARVDIYAEATVAGGTAVPAYNRNRNSSNTATVAVKTGVTSTTGVLIESFYAAYSAIECSTAGTLSGSPAVVVASGFVAASASQKTVTSRAVTARYPLTLDAAGAVRALGTVTLLATGIGNTSALRAALSWRAVR